MEKIIVSACLLGAATRYDGKSKPSISEEKMKKLTLRTRKKMSPSETENG